MDLRSVPSCSATQPVRIACVGDSLTRGDGLHELPHRHRVPAHLLTKSKHFEMRQRGNYPALLQRLLGSGGAVVRNFGHGGATACNVSELPFFATRELDRARKFSADVAIVMLGTNDAKAHYWVCSSHRQCHLSRVDLLLLVCARCFRSGGQHALAARASTTVSSRSCGRCCRRSHRLLCCCFRRHRSSLTCLGYGRRCCRRYERSSHGLPMR
mgnify:CR=1 FL=1